MNLFSPRRRSALTFETLESRWAPASLGELNAPAPLYAPALTAPAIIDAPISNGGGPSGLMSCSSYTAPPSVEFLIVDLVGTEITIYGQVYGELAGGATVTFSGAFEYVTTANEDGIFFFTTNATCPSDIVAIATDSLDQDSEPSIVWFGNSAPSIMIECSMVQPGTWSFWGTVSDESLGHVQVTLAGLPGLESFSITVDSSGYFSFCIALSEYGEVTATVMDVWGEIGTGYCNVNDPGW